MTPMTHLISAVCIVAALMTPARAAEPVYFFSATSDTLTRSSMNLKNGQYHRALHFARVARTEELTPGDQAIAAYNICLSLLSLRRIEDAKPRCEEASTASFQGHVMVDGPDGMKQIVERRLQTADAKE